VSNPRSKVPPARSSSKAFVPFDEWRRRIGWPGLIGLFVLLVLGMREPTTRAWIAIATPAALPVVVVKLVLGRLTTGPRYLAWATFAVQLIDDRNARCVPGAAAGCASSPCSRTPTRFEPILESMGLPSTRVRTIRATRSGRMGSG
jgi:hypothetical protein